MKKTGSGVVTTYLVDDRNLTGYAQVVLETINNSAGEQRQYVYGLERLSQYRTLSSAPAETSYYGYDGHGSVRFLTTTSATITDTYDYDAFGNLVNSTGLTPNEFRFAAEQFDFDLGLYYNRARYLNSGTGRFWTMDTNEGFYTEPLSLHHYLYAVDDPVTRVDPSGRTSSAEQLTAAAGEDTIAGAEASNNTLAFRILQALQGRGATFTVVGSASVVIPNFPALASSFEQGEGLVIELQEELFAIRYVTQAVIKGGVANSPWWGVQLFNDAQAAINELALVQEGQQFPNLAEEIIFGVIPRGTQLIVGFVESQGTLSGGAFQIYNAAYELMALNPQMLVGKL